MKGYLGSIGLAGRNNKSAGLWGDFEELHFLKCARQRTLLMGESPWSALVVGRTQLNSKGVHREVESEGSCRQISGLTNRNHIRLQLRIRLLYKPKSNNYVRRHGLGTLESNGTSQQPKRDMENGEGAELNLFK